MKVYGDLRSGNTLKVKWMADYLGLSHTFEAVDTFGSDTRTAEYLAKFPMGQAPAVEWEDGRLLAQSNAIIRYLANGTPLVPADPFLAAKVDELLFWEQYSHEPYIAVCYSAMEYRGVQKEDREAWRVERGERALDFMEARLKSADWLAADRFSVADVALYAYTRNAGKGGFDLSARPNVTRWIQQVTRQLKLEAN